MNVTERRQVVQQNPDAPATELAQQFSVSAATIYRDRRELALAAGTANQVEVYREDVTSGLEFDKYAQLAQSGVSFHGGAVDEEFQRELQGDGGIKLYTEMAVHPVTAATLFAINMAQRQVSWSVEPAAEEEPDQAAAEFLEQCMADMSQTWDDVGAQVFTMLKFGFSTCELVYKKRLGDKPPAYTKDPAGSRFDDGQLGWRRWQFISPRSMPAGNRWDLDEQGRVKLIRQTPAPDYRERLIPIEKALLFRTSTEFDNPEGISVLRPMYKPWYYATNLAEVEAIGAERLGVGLPVIYLGDGCTMSGANSDLEMAKDIVRNIRADEQMGIVIPRPRLTSEGRGMLLELLSPPSRGFVDFNQVIERYEKRMAMTVL
mgnify:CR=1 FL=1